MAGPRACGPRRLAAPSGTRLQPAANSALPSGKSRSDAQLQAVERFYAQRGLPARYLLSPAAPAGLDEVLAARGYALAEPVLVQTRTLADVASSDPAVPPAPSDGWLRLWAEAKDVGAERLGVAAAILERVAVPAAYAAVDLEGEPAAVGRAALDGDWVGIFSMATTPAVRRRGAARAVLGRLLTWGRAHGATAAYLQVHSRNEGAQRLYEGLGFATAYRYTFRTADHQTSTASAWCSTAATVDASATLTPSTRSRGCRPSRSMSGSWA